jgi:hypothetical protein
MLDTRAAFAIILRRLTNLETLLTKQGAEQMSLEQDVLDAVTAETTAVDGMLAIVQSYAAKGVISESAAKQIISDLKANSDKVNAAIVANTPVAPTQMPSPATTPVADPTVATPAAGDTTTGPAATPAAPVTGPAAPPPASNPPAP